MSYIINNSRGNIVAVVDDGTVNTTATDLALVGRSVVNYGEYQNENYVYLLENFANGSAPLQPILGQLWYNSATDTISAYSTENTWTALASQDYVDGQKISPAFTGVPTAPTASGSTNTTQLATTSFVQNNKISPAFTGTPTAPTASNGTSTTQIATTTYVQNQLSSASGFSSAGTISAAGFLTTGLISATGNVTGGNVLTGGIVSATGNVTGGNLNAAGLSLSSNVVSALNSTSNITTSANVSGNYFLGNGSQLTGIDATSIQNGTSNVRVVSSGGNVTVGIGGTSNVAVFATTGAYVTSNISASGNITGGNILGGANVNATTHTGTTVSVSGNITGGNLITSGGLATNGITNTGGNGFGNIGSSSGYFNQIFATATSALYADLAEFYVADAVYEPGTVLSFGGANEVTLSSISGDTRVAGVVSTNPAYVMNSGSTHEYATIVALTGRVPTRVIGTVRKGDMMISGGNGYAQASNQPVTGSILGKALEDFYGTTGVIEVVIGKL